MKTKAMRRAKEAMEDVSGNRRCAIEKLEIEAEEWLMLAMAPMPTYAIFTPQHCQQESAVCRLAADHLLAGDA